jgi:hypothetical protein
MAGREGAKKSGATLSEEDLLPAAYELLVSQFPDAAKALSKAAKKVGLRL